KKFKITRVKTYLLQTLKLLALNVMIYL
ncbi:Penicillin-binding protein 1A, partial [Haemophilus influenzae]